MSSRFRHLGWLLWLLCVALWIFVALFPISTQTTRLAGIALAVVALAGWLALCWRVAFMRWTLLTLLCLLALTTFLPGRAANVGSLRSSYIRALQRYEGTPYVWGGESFKGIDCSGLIRRGMIDGSFLEGIRIFNPQLIRTAFFLWWHDCTAKDLGEEYLKTTRRFGKATALNAVSYPDLRSGDLAVTSDGVHILAYLGDDTWIEADPSVGKVIRVKIPSTNVWFSTPVNLVRWRILDSPPNA
jgi:hypothetical protein